MVIQCRGSNLQRLVSEHGHSELRILLKNNFHAILSLDYN